MKTRTLTTLTALCIATAFGTAARAETSAQTLAGEQPGYVMEVVYATAQRPRTRAAPLASDAGVVLASEQPGYVMEVVYATASRGEAIARAREAAREAALARQELAGQDEAWTALGTPAR